MLRLEKGRERERARSRTREASTSGWTGCYKISNSGHAGMIMNLQLVFCAWRICTQPCAWPQAQGKSQRVQVCTDGHPITSLLLFFSLLLFLVAFFSPSDFTPGNTESVSTITRESSSRLTHFFKRDLVANLSPQPCSMRVHTVILKRRWTRHAHGEPEQVAQSIELVPWKLFPAALQGLPTDGASPDRIGRWSSSSAPARRPWGSRTRTKWIVDK